MVINMDRPRCIGYPWKHVPHKFGSIIFIRLALMIVILSPASAYSNNLDTQLDHTMLSPKNNNTTTQPYVTIHPDSYNNATTQADITHGNHVFGVKHWDATTQTDITLHQNRPPPPPRVGIPWRYKNMGLGHHHPHPLDHKHIPNGQLVFAMKQEDGTFKYYDHHPNGPGLGRPPEDAPFRRERVLCAPGDLCDNGSPKQPYIRMYEF